jgi:hypothetical protein
VFHFIVLSPVLHAFPRVPSPVLPVFRRTVVFFKPVTLRALLCFSFSRRFGGRFFFKTVPFRFRSDFSSPVVLLIEFSPLFFMFFGTRLLFKRIFLLRGLLCFPVQGALPEFSFFKAVPSRELLPLFFRLSVDKDVSPVLHVFFSINGCFSREFSVERSPLFSCSRRFGGIFLFQGSSA